MPPLISHMLVARRAAAQLATPQLSPSSGDYLLGATSPDIRVLMRWDRRRTHFFDLDEEGHQDCIAEFFNAHPRLRAPDSLNESTRAWTCGFLTHLVMDELYITQVYRPHFGLHSPLGGSERANLLDRILQYELDRREREDPAAMAELRAALYATALQIDAGFIDRETLEQWRDVSANVTEHAADWERFAYVASRHLQRAGIASQADFQDFLDQIPELLTNTLRSVGMANLEAFFEQVTERSAACLQEYLACP